MSIDIKGISSIVSQRRAHDLTVGGLDDGSSDFSRPDFGGTVLLFGPKLAAPLGIDCPAFRGDVLNGK